MNRTYKFKLHPSAEQRELLRRTMVKFNQACSAASELAVENRCFHKYGLHKFTYNILREKFGLPSQLALKAEAKAAATHTNWLMRDKPHVFRDRGAINLDARSFSMPKRHPGMVSISTLKGRILVPCGMWKDLSGTKITGEAKIMWHKPTKSWFVAINSKTRKPKTAKAMKWLGVDMGIVNLATVSDGANFSGGDAERNRLKVTKLRKTLEKCGTRSAKRHLVKISRKESNFKRNVNHLISKSIVSKAVKAPGTGIRLEDLTDIRKTVSTTDKFLPGDLRERLGKWAFGQLSFFIAYKAEAAGIPVEWVKPAYTSQTCSVCGHCSENNRPARDEFVCGACGFRSCADLNAAVNISKGGVNPPVVDGLGILANSICVNKFNHPSCKPPALAVG